MMLLRRLLLIPVWFLTFLAVPFLPKSHPWRWEYKSLGWWARGATSFACEISAALWISVLSAGATLWWLKHWG